MHQLFMKTINETSSKSKRVLWIVVVLTAIAILSACESDNKKSESTDAITDSGVCDGNKCIDAEKEIDAIHAQPGDSQSLDTSMDANDSGDPKPLAACASDDDCSFCSGRSACVFDEDAGRVGHCECDCDHDRDNVLAERCGGGDCDDENRFIRPGAIEICDEYGVDEDCNVNTCSSEKGDQAFEDVDGDKHISTRCYNTDRVTGEKHYAKEWDCDDSRDDVFDGASEECDNRDNNCNGYIDESPGENKHGGQWHTYFPDKDGDHWGSNEDMLQECSKPTGYVERTEDDEYDCNDSDPTIYPLNEEVCDCKDNDCDGKTDEHDRPGEPLLGQPNCANTEVLCDPEECTWVIPDDGCPDGWLHCPGNPIDQCCETPDKTLSTCKDCETNCLFSCGEEGCDEIEEPSVGAFHVCAITAEGRAACWGRNWAGQLGDDTTNASAIPVRVIGITDVKEISAGEGHTCAIVGDDRTVYCWGDNKKGQLGVALSNDSIHAPERTDGVEDGHDPTLSQATSVAAGNEHTCAVYGGGAVACWGNQLSGRLGNMVKIDEPQLSPVSVFSLPYGLEIGNGLQVVAGEAHSCLLTDDKKVLCWGDNTYGQLGDDSAEPNFDIAKEVPGLPEIEFITAGRHHTCALNTSGEVYCWGDNSRLQLGRPSSNDDDIPGIVSGLDGVEIIAIDAGAVHTCALSTSKELMCWGSNAYGERGDENPDYSEIPVVVSIDPTDPIERFAAGGVSCARMESGQAACWGHNKYGQLGYGEQSVGFQPEPQLVHALKGSIP